jgi:hypothetical protein
MSKELSKVDQFSKVEQAVKLLDDAIPAPFSDTKAYLDLEIGEIKNVVFFGTGQMVSEKKKGELVDAALFVDKGMQVYYSMNRMLVGTCIEQDYETGQGLQITRLADKKSKKTGDTFFSYDIKRLIKR